MVQWLKTDILLLLDMAESMSYWLSPQHSVLFTGCDLPGCRFINYYTTKCIPPPIRVCVLSYGHVLCLQVAWLGDCIIAESTSSVVCGTNLHENNKIIFYL